MKLIIRRLGLTFFNRYLVGQQVQASQMQQGAPQGFSQAAGQAQQAQMGPGGQALMAILQQINQARAGAR